MSWCSNDNWYRDRLYNQPARRIPRNTIDSVELPSLNYSIDLASINCYNKIPYLKCNNLSIYNLTDDTDEEDKTAPFSCEKLEGSNISILLGVSLVHWESSKFCEWSVLSLRHIGVNDPEKIDYISNHSITCSSATGTGLYLDSLSAIKNTYFTSKNFYISNSSTDSLCILDVGSGIIEGGDDCSIQGTLYSQDICFSGGAIFQGTGLSTSMVFAAGSENRGSIYINSGIFKNDTKNYGNIIGNIIFDNSKNFGNISGNCLFINGSINQGHIYGEATFNTASINSGTISQNSYYDSSVNYGTISGNAVFINDSINLGNIHGQTFLENSINSGNIQNNCIFKYSTNLGNISGIEHSFFVSNNYGMVYNSILCNFIETGINYGNLNDIKGISFSSGSNNFGNIQASKLINFLHSGENRGNINGADTATFTDTSVNFGSISNSRCIFKNFATNLGEISSGWYYDNTTNVGNINYGLFFNNSSNSGTILTTGIFSNLSRNYSSVNTGLFFGETTNMSDGSIENATFRDKSRNYGTIGTGQFADQSINIGIINSGLFSGRSKNDTDTEIQRAIFMGNSVNFGDIIVTGLFFDSSANYADLSCPVFLSGSANNYGTLNSSGVFVDRSKNRGNCYDKITFYNNAENFGTLLGSGVFKDSSRNRGSWTGASIKFENSSTNVEMGTPTGIFSLERSDILFFDQSQNQASMTTNANIHRIQFFGNSTNNGLLVNDSSNILDKGTILFNNESINNTTISGLNDIIFDGTDLRYPNGIGRGCKNNAKLISPKNIVFIYASNNGPIISGSNIFFNQSVNFENIDSFISVVFSGETNIVSSNFSEIRGYGLCSFSNAVNSGNIDVPFATLQKSRNYGTISSAIFDNLSFNRGRIDNQATFNRRSINSGIIYGNGIFTNSSINSSIGQVYATGQFSNRSCNYGYVNIFISDGTCPTGSIVNENVTASIIGLTDANYFDNSSYQNILYKN